MQFDPADCMAGEFTETITDVLGQIDLGPEVDIDSAIRMTLDFITRMIDQWTELDVAVPLDGGDNELSFANTIPSVDGDVKCRDLLLAFCFDADDFDDVVRQIVYHAGIYCAGTKVVLFITAQWDALGWKRHAHALGHV